MRGSTMVFVAAVTGRSVFDNRGCCGVVLGAGAVVQAANRARANATMERFMTGLYAKTASCRDTPPRSLATLGMTARSTILSQRDERSEEPRAHRGRKDRLGEGRDDLQGREGQAEYRVVVLTDPKRNRERGDHHCTAKADHEEDKRDGEVTAEVGPHLIPRRAKGHAGRCRARHADGDRLLSPD